MREAPLPPTVLLAAGTGTSPWGLALFLGTVLLIGVAFAWAAHRIYLPRVIGLLLAGVALKLMLTPFNDALPALIGALKPLKLLGLGLILFSVGSVFEARQLRIVGRSALWVVLGESGLTFVLVGVAVAATAWGTGATGADGASAMRLGLLLGIGAIATAPAATLFVLREYGAKGTTTNTILAVVGLNNVLCVVLFHVVFAVLAALGWLGAETTLSPAAAAQEVFLVTVGSVVIGIAGGLLLSLAHAHLREVETFLVLLGLLLGLGALEYWLRARGLPPPNFLLSALCTGAVFANISVAPDRLDGIIRTGGEPIFVAFFVLAGLQFHFADWATAGWVGLAYVLARVAGKWGGAMLAVRGARHTHELRPELGAALFCQAAVLIGLADFISAHWHEETGARLFVATALGSVVIFELCGPLLVKRAAVRAGEVKAEALLARHEESGWLSTILPTILRAFGRAARPSPQTPHNVGDLMRANVQCLRAGDDLNAVLRFVERSPHDVFPVVDSNDRLLGLIRFADIQQMLYSPALVSLVTALDLVSRPAEGLPPDTSTETALERFHAQGVGMLPVIADAQDKRVIGMIEQRDLLATVARDGSGAPGAGKAPG